MVSHINPTIQDLLSFLNNSPTAWHATANIAEKLHAAGYRELQESEAWNLTPGNSFFLTRNGSSLCAFTVPSKKPRLAYLLASHTDSPALKLKPNAEYQKQNMIMIGVETYGAPLLNAWLNRDLGIAGRISYLDASGLRKTTLVRLDHSPLVIPQLAIHLDREVNERGLVLNKQEHLNALATLINSSEGKANFLERKLQEKINFSLLLSHDLFLYPLEKASLLGEQQMIGSYRIDNLTSVHAALTALCHSKKASEDRLNMGIFWDNEEVGSSTAQGAGSPFFQQILERILIALGMNREEYLRLLSQSLCFSIDLGHALHPNYPERHDPQHQPLLGKGIIIKSNAQQRYSTDAESAALLSHLCIKLQLPYQKFSSRSDIPSGTTVGPIHASMTGMKTIDIGSAQLSMHSSREIASCQDHLDMCRLLTALFEMEE